LKAQPPADVLPDAQVVVSAIPPALALATAQDVAQHLGPDCLYVDMNSVSGPTAKQIATVIKGRGGRCVDAAIMGPVPLMALQVPIILSGAAAPAFHDIVEGLGWNTSVLSLQVGDASSLKMLWSVVTKGTIALLAESLIAAHRLGLVEPLTRLLAEQYGTTGSEAMLLRMLGSTVRSGSRRLGEMDEAGKTLESAAVPGWTVEATKMWIRELSRIPDMESGLSVAEMVQSISDQLGSAG
jgi:3-hydroxyisobutyrate dehydrogenase-like beta-hydroxyacid dehydrogenase